MLVCFLQFISKVSILDVNAIMSSFTDASLNIPNMEIMSRVDIATDQVEY